MPGGTETDVQAWRLQLAGAPGGLDPALVLRRYAGPAAAARALRESRIQSAIFRAGYPAPEVFLTCTDPEVLGGAFYLMRFIEGENLAAAPPATVPGVLSRAHLALHVIAATPTLSAALTGTNVPTEPETPAEDLARLARQARQVPRLLPVVEWMSDHVPAAPSEPTICHGDFHPLNILVRNEQLAGVLDWPGASLGTRERDVGATLTLAIPARRLFRPAPPPALWERYLEEYRRSAPLEEAALDYYRVRRALTALLSGAAGRQLWRHPGVLADLIEDIRLRTGVHLPTPPWDERSGRGRVIGATSPS